MESWKHHSGRCRYNCCTPLHSRVLKRTGIGTSNELGKTAGKDAAHHEPTFATLLGIDRAQATAIEYIDRAVALLRQHGLDCRVPEGLAKFIVERRR
jgi:geranylgeranyl pyrophosphate synthase